MMANLSASRRLIIFLAVLPFLNEFSYSQTLLQTKNELFILGTLSDYMGREIVPGMKGMLDRYDQTEGPLVDALDSIIKKTYLASPIELIGDISAQNKQRITK